MLSENLYGAGSQDSGFGGYDKSEGEKGGSLKRSGTLYAAKKGD